MTLGQSTQDGTPHSAIQPTNSKQDLVEVASILAQHADGLPENADGSQPLVAELLKNIAATDNVVKGVEERLDGIIENLDLLLSALEEDAKIQQLSQANAVTNGKGDKQSSS